MGAVGELSRLSLTGLLSLSIEHHRYQLESTIATNQAALSVQLLQTNDLCQ